MICACTTPKGLRWAIGTFVALTGTAAAQSPPPGWSPATVSGRVPEGSKSIDGYVPRKFCNLTVPMKVERDGQLMDASARVVCTK